MILQSGLFTANQKMSTAKLLEVIKFLAAQNKELEETKKKYEDKYLEAVFKDCHNE